MKYLARYDYCLNKINFIANSFLDSEGINDGDLLIKQLENIYFLNFGYGDISHKNWDVLKKEIDLLKYDDYDKFILKLSKMGFKSNYFTDFLSLLNRYLSYINLSFKERKFQEVFEEIFQLFIKQIGGIKFVLKNSKKVGGLFEEWLKKQNDDLYGRKPIELLKEINPDFNINGFNIQGVIGVS